MIAVQQALGGSNPDWSRKDSHRRDVYRNKWNW
jgi:hypothetical protein